MTEPQENLIWEGHPSHLRYFWLYLVCWLFCWLVVPFFIWLWKWLEVRNHIYRLTTERLRISQGIFTRRSEELELYRVRDLSVEEPFWYRVFGRGNIVLTTLDVTTPTVTLVCIPNITELRDKLRQAVEECRDRKRSRVAEFTEDSPGDHPPAS
jgi:uncharacterized membrane protein YdbT with pleckstrin-like domain